MVSQEDIFCFFQEISVKIQNDGYPILDNIIHEFLDYPTEQEIWETRWEDQLLEPPSENED